jgi:hypothetical protein
MFAYITHAPLRCGGHTPVALPFHLPLPWDKCFNFFRVLILEVVRHHA